MVRVHGWKTQDSIFGYGKGTRMENTQGCSYISHAGSADFGKEANLKFALATTNCNNFHFEECWYPFAKLEK